MRGKKRAVTMTRTVQPSISAQGVVQKQVDLCAVFELDTTLEELLDYLQGKNTNTTTVVFESEAPELCKDESRKRGL